MLSMISNINTIHLLRLGIRFGILLQHGHVTVLRTPTQHHHNTTAIHKRNWRPKHNCTNRNHEHLLHIGCDTQRQGTGQLVRHKTANIQRKRTKSTRHYNCHRVPIHTRTQIYIPSFDNLPKLPHDHRQYQTLNHGQRRHLTQQIHRMHFQISCQHLTARRHLQRRQHNTHQCYHQTQRGICHVAISRHGHTENHRSYRHNPSFGHFFTKAERHCDGNGWYSAA
mmetsp:Transcript_14669/g.22223  ORF Transcript_14669/g.22223 Transcript_14669/m.22223 type:complete len:224 (+) Transcript_14669:323-994(+)